MRVAVLLLLLSASAAMADSIIVREGKATLTVSSEHLKEPDRKIPLSDLLTMTCKVPGSNPLQVEVDPLEVDAKVWKHTALPVKQTSERTWHFDPLQPGKLPIPVVTVRYRDGPEQPWTTVRFREITIDVVGPADKLKTEIRGDLPLETIPETPFTKTTFPLRELLLGGAVLLLIGGFVFLVRRPKPRQLLPADQRALQELDRLSRATPPPDQPGWLHARVSSVVRGYLDERFGLPAPRQTSEEVLVAVRQSGQVPDDILGKIEELCRVCDQVKFAGSRPTGVEDAALVNLARQIIEATPVKPVT